MNYALRHCLVWALLCVALPASAQPLPPNQNAPEDTPAPEPLPDDQTPDDQTPDEQLPDEQLPDAPIDPTQAPIGDPIGTAADPGADGAQAPEDEGENEDSDLLGDEHRPVVELRIADGEIYTGDVVTLTLTALAPALDDISVPSEQEVAPFEILDTDVRTEERPDGVLHTFTLELLALEPGEHELAPFRIRVLTPEGVIGHVDSEALTIRVASVIGNEPNAEPRPPTQPVPLMEEDPTLYWVGGALLLILLTALFTWIFARWWRAREKAAAPPPPPRPPEEIALEKLNALRQRRDAMLREGQGVEFVDHVSDAVREYLGHRFSFEGLESTTDEVLARMRKRKLRGVGIDEIAGLLQDCDLVKFAKADFTLEQSELLLSGSFRIVRATTNAMPAQSMAPRAVPAAPTTAPAAQDSAEARWMPKPAAPDAAAPDAATTNAESASTNPSTNGASEPAPSPEAHLHAPLDVASPPAYAVESAPEARPIPDTVPPGTKAAAALAAAADAVSTDAVAADAVSTDAVAADAAAARPIPDTIPPKAPSSGDDPRSAETLRGLPFDAAKVAAEVAKNDSPRTPDMDGSSGSEGSGE
ncbi:MAG: hypothetical protein AB8H86_16505 [Polyangiales bacterium]